jgi:trehalose 6-phosphate phosphatase
VASGAAPAAGGPAAADRLAPWVDQPQRAGVLVDYDGTIAPIVDDPDTAIPFPGAVDTLTRLAARYQVVAVISGRPVAFLSEQLDSPPGLILVGLYGLERVRDGATETHPEADRWRSVVDRVAAAAEAQAPAGVNVERKGLAVTLHVRTAPQEGSWIETWAAKAAAATGLSAMAGRKSVELRPPVDADKGTVVTELATDLGAACFLGDDRGDLPAFEALRRLAERGVHTLAVAVGSDESPPELLEAADVVVLGPPGALALLNRLAATAG